MNISGQLIDIGGYRLCLNYAGQGSPTVIIDSGGGEGASAWSLILAEVAKFTAVCSYDRAGVGQSEPSPKPRTSEQMVQELHILLQNAAVLPPYVLVGHSFGGLNMQLYASHYPDQIAGIVLLDPTFSELVGRIELHESDRLLALWNSQFDQQTEGISQANFAASCQQVAGARQLPNVPLIVLSAAQPVPLPPEFQDVGLAILQIMMEGHAALVKRAAQGQHILAEKSNHQNIKDQPELIVAAIRQVVEAARNQLLGENHVHRSE